MTRTATLIKAVVATDPEISDDTLATILRLIETGASNPSPVEIGELDAAAILCISRSELNRWRRGQLPSLGPFPFRYFSNPAGRAFYRETELLAYRAEHEQEGAFPA